MVQLFCFLTTGGLSRCLARSYNSRYCHGCGNLISNFNSGLYRHNKRLRQVSQAIAAKHSQSAAQHDSLHHSLNSKPRHETANAHLVPGESNTTLNAAQDLDDGSQQTDPDNLKHEIDGSHDKINSSERGEQEGASFADAAASQESGPVLDLEHLRSTMSYPRSEDYPEVSLSSVFIPQLAKNAVVSLCGTHKLELNAEIDMKQRDDLAENFIDKLPAGSQKHVFSCELSVEIVNIVASRVVGEGRTKTQARQAAWARFMAGMHADGLLRSLLSGGQDASIQKPSDDTTDRSRVPTTDDYEPQMTHQTIDKNILDEEKDAKLEILNYTVGLWGLAPTFTAERVKSDARNSKSSVQSLVQANIAIPERNISISAVGNGLVQAEVAAALQFKRMAQENDWPRDTNITQWTALNTETAQDFMYFYKSRQSDSVIELENEGMTYAESSQNEAFMTVNGRLLCSIRMGSKRQAARAVDLLAATTLVREDPRLLDEFQAAVRSGGGRFLKSISPRKVTISSNTIEAMRRTLLTARQSGLSDVRQALAAEAPNSNDESQHYKHKLSTARAQQISAQLRETYEQSRSDEKLQTMRCKRATLPMAEYSQSVVDMINRNTYSIVMGATGSGKTTQVPQMLLENAIQNGSGAHCNIICTQPRRIAAISVAKRVAEERCEPLRKSVGYHVRYDASVPQGHGSITFCTTGILLQRLKYDPDSVFDSASHILVDEVHERDLNIDFLMIMLKRLVKTRLAKKQSIPHIVLMSATLDHRLFSEYFSEEGNQCPSISVPGRAFPITRTYLAHIISDLRSKYGKTLDFLLNRHDSKENKLLQTYLDEETSAKSHDEGPIRMNSEIDWKRPFASDQAAEQSQALNSFVPSSLVVATIANICASQSEGAILAFLPGFDEISKVDGTLKGSAKLCGLDFSDTSKFKILRLHSALPKDEQLEIFNPVAPGCRKIILATNIAETSVTVPDVRFVVDCGKTREMRYDQTSRISKLECVWESKSNAMQRAGRAGRVQNGHYYALFSKKRYDSLRSVGLSELTRSDLSETALAVKASFTGQTIAPFLSEAIEPPPNGSVQSALAELQSIEALTDTEQLTDLGRILSRLPVHPRLAKMIILGILFRCVDPMIVIGAASDEPTIFNRPLGIKAEAREKQRVYDDHTSDHLALYKAYKELRGLAARKGKPAAKTRAFQQYLSWDTYRKISRTADDIEQILVNSGLMVKTEKSDRQDLQCGPPPLNENSHNANLVKSLLLAGFSPNLGVPQGFTSRTPRERGVVLHPSSLLDRRIMSKMRDSDSMLTYTMLSRSNDGRHLFMRDVSSVTPMMALLFGGRLDMTSSSRLELSSWLPFSIDAYDPAFATKLTLEFKKALDRVLSSAFRSLPEKDSSNQGSFAENPMREQFVRDVIGMLEDTDLGKKQAD